MFERFYPYTPRGGLGCQLLKLGHSFQLLLLLSWLQSCFSVGSPTGLAENPWLSLGIDMHRLQPVGRLAGNQYAHIHDIFEMKRPNENYRG